MRTIRILSKSLLKPMPPKTKRIGIAMFVSALMGMCVDAAGGQCRFNGLRGYTTDTRPSPQRSCLPLYRFEAVSSADRKMIVFDSDGRRYTARLGGGQYYYIEKSDVSPATTYDFAAVFRIDKEGMMTNGYCGDGFIVLALDKCK